MKLRNLEERDAPFMLEWMHEDFVVHHLKTDFQDKTIEDCRSFIETAQNSDESIHFAITDELDEYMGTVSLKHMKDQKAEFGIAIRSKAMGKGISAEAMKEILRYGFEEKGLQMIYWCVDPENARAVRFYDKNGYVRCQAPDDLIGYSEDEIERFIWYACGNPHNGIS